MGRATDESGTVTRKSDDKVGSAGSEPAGGGHQTAEQAAITGMGSGGKDEEARKRDMSGGVAGASPPAIGGSSGGHSDQTASRGPAEDAKVAGGHSRAERGDDDGRA
ncbi:hypothetical protein [Methylobacterium sp. J-076]|uniref:hypothetical protein n=1 Tax=Methylobacterium sp. J-076 TaxID=2836655 RepID=UPI001FBBA7F2|nr:hypothetical protein [Methylobacterium sp. J-076]MCJ2014434.1 hypothetical protein [Methylobacterium sp. J-076]